MNIDAFCDTVLPVRHLLLLLLLLAATAVSQFIINIDIISSTSL
jgi:hypothetical protein